MEKESTSSSDRDSSGHKSVVIDVMPNVKKLPSAISHTSKSIAQKLFDDKEESHRLYKDEVYSLSDWQKAKAWHRHLPSRDGVEILHGFAWLVVYCFVISMLVCSYHYWIEPLGAPGWADNDSDVWQVFNLTSFALALLLVFRTNASYGRWWEARILWGSQINMTRDIVRRAISWFPEEADDDLLLMFARWSVAMSYALKGHLRGEDKVRGLQRVLPQHELSWVAESNHVPNTVSQILSDILVEVNMPEFRRVTLDQDLQRYLDILGSCERILKTPIHRNWTSHTSRFTLVWLTFFPFALWPVYGWATPAIEVVVSWLLLGIENIGVQIEEPFAVLALESYCLVCENSVQGLMSHRLGSKAMIGLAKKTKLGARANSLGGHGLPSRLDWGGKSTEFLQSLEAKVGLPENPHRPRGSVEL